MESERILDFADASYFAEQTRSSRKTRLIPCKNKVCKQERDSLHLSPEVEIELNKEHKHAYHSTHC